MERAGSLGGLRRRSERLPDPGPGEARVRVQACGVCHTDLHYREGGIGEDFPYLLGHEAAGVVEAVGDGVTGVAPGDFVILNWRAVCGQCRACKRGRPWYCFATHNAAQKMTLADGTVIPPTNKSFRVDFCTVAHWKNGQIVEENLFYDLMGMLTQIGVLPPKGNTKAA